MGKYLQKLIDNKAAGRYACAGLDPLDAKIPEHLKKLHASDPFEAWRNFLYAHVRHSAPHAAAFKPNWAFFLAKGHRGLWLLEDVCNLIHKDAPHALLTLDMKCGDIGDTNIGYVKFAFEICGADAVTVHPYMGSNAMKPFLADPDRGVFVLCKTSNDGSGEFQDLALSDGDKGNMNYKQVARTVDQKWNENGNCGLVTGATYHGPIEKIREITNVPLLIPGIGKQGGDLKSAVLAATSNCRWPSKPCLPMAPFIVNQSTTYLYASGGEDYAEAGAMVLKKMNDDIQAILRPSPAYRTPA